VLTLVTVTTALVQALHAINHCELTQPGTVAKWRQVGLSDRAGYSKLNILIHSVDKLNPVDYIMLHGVADYNIWRLHLIYLRRFDAYFD
jgi:uncharacterized Fe-S cluster-containing radical SAM superfamily enzyme